MDANNKDKTLGTSPSLERLDVVADGAEEDSPAGGDEHQHGGGASSGGTARSGKTASASLYVLECNNTSESDTIQLVTGSVWAFLPPPHVRIAKAVFVVFWCVAVFAALSALGYPLANHVPVECREPVEDFFYSFGFFGIMVTILFPWWAKSFFDHMLDALQQGLQPFCQPYDREVTIGLGCGIVGATCSALYGLHVAPPPTLGSSGPAECAHCHDVVRSSSWSFLLSVGVLSLMHVVHYQYLCRARQKYMDSRRVVLY